MMIKILRKNAKKPDFSAGGHLLSKIAYGKPNFFGFFHFFSKFFEFFSIEHDMMMLHDDTTSML